MDRKGRGVGAMWETPGDKTSSYCCAQTSPKYWTFCATDYKNLLLLPRTEGPFIYNHSGFRLAGYSELHGTFIQCALQDG